MNKKYSYKAFTVQFAEVSVHIYNRTPLLGQNSNNFLNYFSDIIKAMLHAHY